MDFSTIIYNAEEGVGMITMNRPKVINAINDEFAWELYHAIDLIEEDNNVGTRVVTVTKFQRTVIRKAVPCHGFWEE